MIIACIGDSLTEGDYGIKGKTGIANVQPESYPYFLGKMMRCEVRNFGKCGFRSVNMLKRYDEGLIDLTDCDIVIMMLGSNGGQSPDSDTEDNRAYMELISRIRRDAPKARLILMTPPNATEDASYSNCGYMPQVRDAQDFVRNVAADNGIELIDLGRSLFFRPERESIYQSNDGLHFSFIGYAKMAETVYNAIAKYRVAPYGTVKLDSNVKLVAHRGLSGIECENTAASFTAAGNRSYYGIETDIWLTKDGQPVCSHDNHTRRLCNTVINIPDTDFAEVRALKLNDVDRVTPCGHYVIPTLEEYVRICKKYNKHAVPELKADFTKEQIQQIIDVFDKYDYLDNTTFIAFNIANLDLVKEILPEQDCQFLTSSADISALAEMLEARRMNLDCEYSVVTKSAIDVLHAHGVKVNVWTVDNPDAAKYLVDCGVDYITTNIMENA